MPKIELDFRPCNTIAVPAELPLLGEFWNITCTQITSSQSALRFLALFIPWVQKVISCAVLAWMLFKNCLFQYIVLLKSSVWTICSNAKSYQKKLDLCGKEGVGWLEKCLRYKPWWTRYIEPPCTSLIRLISTLTDKHCCVYSFRLAQGMTVPYATIWLPLVAHGNLCTVWVHGQS